MTGSAEIDALVTRLSIITDPHDPIWAGLQALLDRNQEIETSSLCAPAISDGEVHRGRGRLGMLIDLRAQLDELHRQSQLTPEQRSGELDSASRSS